MSALSDILDETWKVEFLEALRRGMKPHVAARVIGGRSLQAVQAELERDADFAREFRHVTEGAGRELATMDRTGLPDTTDVKELCQALTTDAVYTLRAVMMNEKAPQAARVKAATSILERGWGKIPDGEQDAGEELRQRMKGMGLDELKRVAAELKDRREAEKMGEDAGMEARVVAPEVDPAGEE